MMLAVRCTRARAEGPIRPVTIATNSSGPYPYIAFLSSVVSLDGTLHAPATAQGDANMSCGERAPAVQIVGAPKRMKFIDSGTMGERLSHPPDV